jgi:hypothetical protein
MRMGDIPIKRMNWIPQSSAWAQVQTWWVKRQAMASDIAPVNPAGTPVGPYGGRTSIAATLDAQTALREIAEQAKAKAAALQPASSLAPPEPVERPDTPDRPAPEDAEAGHDPSDPPARLDITA